MNTLRGNRRFDALACWAIALAVLAFGAASASEFDTDEFPDFTEDAEVDEPDYAAVAADARKIADEIEERLIEEHMDDGTLHLSKSDPFQGHPKVNEAYMDMEEMIKFCESVAGGAGSACRFKLEIKMGMNPGSTLGQMSKGLKPGSGIFGNMGQGASGYAGSQTPFGLFAPDSFGKQSSKSKSIGPKKAHSDAIPDGAPDPLAGNVEELGNEKNTDLEFNVEGDERIMEEYRRMIEAYFQRLAEEE